MLREKIHSRLKETMREKDSLATNTIRLIIAALKDRDIAARGQGNADGLGEDEILAMLKTMVKQRQESIKMYTDAGRDELAEREQNEITIIETFLPEQMDDAAVEQAVETIIEEIQASSIKDMGKVMAELKNRYVGQMDMGKASGVVKDKLVG